MCSDGTRFLGIPDGHVTWTGTSRLDEFDLAGRCERRAYALLNYGVSTVLLSLPGSSQAENPSTLL